MTKSEIEEFWEDMKDKAIDMFNEGASYYEIKCALIDKAIVEDVDIDYTVRELYSKVTLVASSAFKEFNANALKEVLNL